VTLFSTCPHAHSGILPGTVFAQFHESSIICRLRSRNIRATAGVFNSTSFLPFLRKMTLAPSFLTVASTSRTFILESLILSSGQVSLNEVSSFEELGGEVS
jgi:hypothetical protein